MTTPATCRCPACNAARNGKPAAESDRQPELPLEPSENLGPLPERVNGPRSDEDEKTDQGVNSEPGRSTEADRNFYEHPAIASSVALSLHAKNIKRSPAARLETAMALMRPPVYDEAGNVVGYGAPLIDAEEFLALLG